MAAQLLRVSGASWLIRKVGTWKGLVVMNYHRVGEASSSTLNQELWSATQDGLDAQIKFFKSHCDVIGEADVADVLKRDKGRYLQLTFDDGYRDAHDGAFPVLKANGVTATFFLATGFLDQPKVPWWDEIAWMVKNGSPRFGGRGPREAVINTLTGVYRALPPGRQRAIHAGQRVDHRLTRPAPAEPRRAVLHHPGDLVPPRHLRLIEKAGGEEERRRDAVGLQDRECPVVG